LSRDPSAPKHAADLLQTLLSGTDDDERLVSFLLRETGLDLKGYSIPEFMDYMRRQSGKNGSVENESRRERPSAPVQASLLIPPPEPSTRPAKTAKSKAVLNGRWIEPDETVIVAGLTLHGGLFYVGHKLKNGSWHDEPSLINPELAVAATPDGRLPSIYQDWGFYHYDPDAYATLTPGNRRRYLEWLAGGRSDPDVDQRLLLLFCMGLERRALHEKVRTDFPVILAELWRLLDVYSSHDFFREKARELITVLEAVQLRERQYLSSPDLDYAARGLSPGIRIPLGQLAKDKKPLTPDWALAWALADSRISRYKPVWNCPDAFRKLFRLLFVLHFPKGIPLPVNKSRINFYYQPLSQTISGVRCQLDLPDMGRVTAPVKALQQLVNRCVADLQSYSRAVSRNPDKAMALETLLLLPPEVWPDSLTEALAVLAEDLGDGVLALPLAALVSRLHGEDKLSPTQLRGLAEALHHAHIGMEPDPLHGGKLTNPEDTVCLFRESTEAREARETPAFLAAMTTIDAAARVTITAESDPAATQRWLDRRIDTWVHLHPDHRCRLQARFRAQCERPATLNALKPRLEALPAAARRPVAQLLAQAACQADMPSAATVKLLEKCYQHLGVDRALLYSDLHAPAPTGSHRPAAVPGAALTLDPERIARLQQETAQVSALLAEVFVEDEPEVVTTPRPESPAADSDSATIPETDTDTLWGLDADHSALLRQLLTRPSWTRAEVQALAAALGLMTDGALEHLNEAAFDHADGPLTEGDDPLEINPDILENPPA